MLVDHGVIPRKDSHSLYGTSLLASSHDQFTTNKCGNRTTSSFGTCLSADMHLNHFTPFYHHLFITK
jgi:hypothetical protein